MPDDVRFRELAEAVRPLLEECLELVRGLERNRAGSGVRWLDLMRPVESALEGPRPAAPPAPRRPTGRPRKVTAPTQAWVMDLAGYAQDPDGSWRKARPGQSWKEISRKVGLPPGTCSKVPSSLGVRAQRVAKGRGEFATGANEPSPL
jgi:hypothetical protein